MLRLPDSWVWDSWLADDGEEFHLFFLFASRALHHPDARHHRASVGHAVSQDLRHWERVEDALVRRDAPAFDDLATWTGSTVRHPDGTWYLFYTGATMRPWRPGRPVLQQRIAYATSTDLLTWERQCDVPVFDLDPQWYELAETGPWGEDTCRDPWVLADPGGDGWHLLFTARATTGESLDRGVLGHAWSPDLRRWELRPPLSSPGAGFGQLEVPQVVEVDGAWSLVFSCLEGETSPERRSRFPVGGTWVAPAQSPLGPFDIADARPLSDRGCYAGRVVAARDGRPQLLGFVHDESDGSFGGWVADPLDVRRDGRHLVAG